MPGMAIQRQEAGAVVAERRQIELGHKLRRALDVDHRLVVGLKRGGQA